jgi:hypothetical protein
MKKKKYHYSHAKWWWYLNQVEAYHVSDYILWHRGDAIYPGFPAPRHKAKYVANWRQACQVCPRKKLAAKRKSLPYRNEHLYSRGK